MSEWTITDIAYTTTTSTTTSNSSVIYSTSSDNTVTINGNNTAWPWYQPPNTTIPWNPPAISTPSPYVYPNPNITYPTIEIIPTIFPSFPPGQWWPALDDAVGILYIEDGKLKLRTNKGEDFVIVDLKDEESDVVVNLMAVIARKKLEEAAEKSGVGAAG